MVRNQHLHLFPLQTHEQNKKAESHVHTDRSNTLMISSCNIYPLRCYHLQIILSTAYSGAMKFKAIWSQIPQNCMMNSLKVAVDEKPRNVGVLRFWKNIWHNCSCMACVQVLTGCGMTTVSPLEPFWAVTTGRWAFTQTTAAAPLQSVATRSSQTANTTGKSRWPPLSTVQIWCVREAKRILKL